ncbi:hypothetical protein U1Q18_026742 [Sarracenia purpurea var. burkii]
MGNDVCATVVWTGDLIPRHRHFDIVSKLVVTMAIDNGDERLTAREKESIGSKAEKERMLAREMKSHTKINLAFFCE